MQVPKKNTVQNANDIMIIFFVSRNTEESGHEAISGTKNTVPNHATLVWLVTHEQLAVATAEVNREIIRMPWVGLGY